MNQVLKNRTFNIDKSKWEPVKLCDLAHDISERADEPGQSKYDRFVGLEHFVSGDLKIRKWGSTKELGSSMKVFRAGDILFARRNAYLRRASLVDFDGICSGDAFVIRENHERIIPRFLVFVLNSDSLWDYANANAAGTMSKRVKWRDLGEYEFLLPPKDQQARLAELLWAGDEVLERYNLLERSGDSYFEASKNELTLRGLGQQTFFDHKLKQEVSKDWRICTIGDLLTDGSILEIQDGNHGELHPKASDYSEEGIPFIMANTLSRGRLLLGKAERLPKALTDKLRIGFSKPGDVLLSHKGTVGEIAVVPSVINWEYVMLTPQVTYYRVNEAKLSNKFLFYVFGSTYFQRQLKTLSSQSTRAYVGITAQQGIRIAIPNSVDLQLKIANKLERLDQSFRHVLSVSEASKDLQKALINKIF